MTFPNLMRVSLVLLFVLTGEARRNRTNSKDLRQNGSLTDVEQVASGNFKFSSNLYGALNVSKEKNLVFSPWSLSGLMAMLKMGARGQTAQEIQGGLQFPPKNKNLKTGYSHIMSSFQEKSDDYVLTTANRVYIQKDFPIRPKYEKSLKKFGAGIQSQDFGNGQVAAGEINGWVSNQTNGLIRDLIDPDSLSNDTRLVLVNAIYFKGLWDRPFDPSDTRKMPFFLNKTDSVMVDMMSRSKHSRFAFISQIDATAVLLPYKGSRLSMIVYLPTARDGLAKVEEGLKTLNLSEILRGMTYSRSVDLFLPKFKVESDMDLVEPLNSLGLKTMFSQQADFGGIADSKSGKMYVSQVIQKAVIQVNEEGSEGAAASAGGLTLLSMPPRVKVDHPFLFHIVDHQNNLILFTGRCVNPLISA